MPTTTTTAAIIVAPILERPGYYTARCDGRLLCRSRQPFLDGARVLLDTGYSADTTIVMRHVGSEIEALRSTIGVAAKLAVEDDHLGRPQFRRWRGPRGTGAAPPIAPTLVIATSEPKRAVEVMA